MNSDPVGEFREIEIHGAPVIIYTLLSRKDRPSESGGDDLPLFLCPFFRSTVAKLKPYEGDLNHYCFPLVVPPQFPLIKDGQQQPEYMLQSDSCKLPLRLLKYKTTNNVSTCSACLSDDELRKSYYSCACGNHFHKECVWSPLELKHPSYPSLSLQLYSSPEMSLKKEFRCFCCQTVVFGMIYYSPTYNVHLNLFCAFKPIPIDINHPKRHPHLLTFFPKQTSLVCDVCGVINVLFPTYVCVRCIFVVHRDCIDFPFVIKISRHHHRISFTPSLPSGKWSCGICRQKVNNDCGAYSCNKCDDYVFHSRCALRRDVWDGKELDGVPEEPEIVVEPFQRIADGVVLHFSHDHHLKLEISKVYDDNKLCQGCVLPIYEGSYYSCTDNCDFNLHEACANAPCKKHHALNPYPLTLKVVSNEGHFKCDACRRKSCGFIYENHAGWGFKLDLRCASVSEPFEYQGHEHPLFLALKPEEERSAICQICQPSNEKSFYYKKLNCIECDFVICFKCATLPYKAKYQHDKHFLTFQKGKEESNHSGWCEVCEKILEYSGKGGFYACDDCCTTLHVDCLLGENMYLKSGHTITHHGSGLRAHYLHIVRNNTFSRPYCWGCWQRCPQKVVFKEADFPYCALSCHKRQINM